MTADDRQEGRHRVACCDICDEVFCWECFHKADPSRHFHQPFLRYEVGSNAKVLQTIPWSEA